MEVLRTPDERFEGLPDWPYEPRYVEVDAGDGSGTKLRVHYIDEGPRDAAEGILLMHGEPRRGSGVADARSAPAWPL